MITKLGFVAGEYFGQGEDCDGDGDGEDGFGGIALRPVHKSPKFYFEAPEQPRHPHWAPPQHSSERRPARPRNPQTAERARQARIASRRNS
ncbi:MAG TPA: hypothetical protein DEB73_00860 [Candidatus Magasanikbacteria bacterium]|uniref:Uncharacterized protein n=1 Tax=Candidatus Magasanikbacteria bacterium GW2011_GWC2_41_17 TaxID=1619048 RepID=A0A0G0YAR4_9BACT|nr:MAG: hypothetical protein UU49_C0032G0005 [Candidatus Magasanikbacteria bacterium GW2011_GWC2_41_17]HBV57807.1 hypothetical protein [Candidatus Magasanikbacteria bacterium]HBX15813.1 hypothetical protein [Candidatus Magasanikbacteria bacterium]